MEIDRWITAQVFGRLGRFFLSQLLNLIEGGFNGQEEQETQTAQDHQVQYNLLRHG
jgi:hypothetical protein